MARVLWPLVRQRPAVEVVLLRAPGGALWVRTLLADTGAGSRQSRAELILAESDCLLCGGIPDQPLALGGAYTGSFPSCVLRVQIPALAFDRSIRVVAAARLPAGFDGIACFPFLSRFTYGNFGDPNQFGLES